MITEIPDNFIRTCSDIRKYRNVEKIGEGVFGQVFKAEYKKTKDFVVVKKLLNLEISSIASSTYRRIKILKKLKHVNVVQIIEVCRFKKIDKMEIFTIMPLYDYNLTYLIQNSQVQLTVPIVKYILHQLLKSVSYIHGHNIIHRNLKPSNIFVSKDGVLKIGDFGLACSFWLSESVSHTNEMLSYRAPELLLGSPRYDRLVDMWSVGCIFAELCTRRNVFKSDCLQNQFALISDLCGSICPEVWPGVEYIKSYKEFQLPQGVERNLRMKMKGKVNGYFGINLLDKLLVLNPEKRITANEAFNHKYFNNTPRKDELVKIL